MLSLEGGNHYYQDLADLVWFLYVQCRIYFVFPTFYFKETYCRYCSCHDGVNLRRSFFMFQLYLGIVLATVVIITGCFSYYQVSTSSGVLM